MASRYNFIKQATVRDPYRIGNTRRCYQRATRSDFQFIRLGYAQPSCARSKIDSIVSGDERKYCVGLFSLPCSFPSDESERGNRSRDYDSGFARSSAPPACKGRNSRRVIPRLSLSRRDAFNILVRCAGNDLITIRLRDASLARFVARLCATDRELIRAVMATMLELLAKQAERRGGSADLPLLAPRD